MLILVNVQCYVVDDVTTEETVSTITTMTDLLTTVERTNRPSLTEDLSTTQSTNIPANTLTGGNLLRYPIDIYSTE